MLLFTNLYEQHPQTFEAIDDIRSVENQGFSSENFRAR